MHSSSVSFETGLMWDQVRSIDWSQTSLGPRDNWPKSLKATLRMILASKQTICFWWGPELRQFHNERYMPLLGDRAEGSMGKPFLELWPDVADDVMPMMKTALSGEGTWVENMPLTMTRYGYPEQTYWSFSYSPLYDDEGRIAGVLNITTETTQYVNASIARQDENEALSDALDDAQDTIVEQRERERTRRIVQRELAHRLKNSFSMVNAIVSQSMRGDVSLEDARSTISARIQALANAQDVLVNAAENGALIGEVVDTALKPHEHVTRQIEVVGPEIAVPAQQGMGIALAVHELATNAAKYGALSVPDGRISVSWSLDSGDFRFDWRETGGPEPTPSTRKGFGSRILERIVPGYFTGVASSRFEATGLTYSLSGKVGDDQAH